MREWRLANETSLMQGMELTVKAFPATASAREKDPARRNYKRELVERAKTAVQLGVTCNSSLILIAKVRTPQKRSAARFSINHGPSGLFCNLGQVGVQAAALQSDMAGSQASFQVGHARGLAR